MTRQIITPWDDHVMLPAFLGAVHWALGQLKIVGAFREATGNQYEPPKDGLSAAIDAATGADFDFIQQFVDWFAENHFGRPEDLETAA